MLSRIVPRSARPGDALALGAMRITVLGGTGFIGPFVVRRLAAEGHQVTVVHRGEHERDDLGEGVRHVHTDRAELSAAMGEIGDADVALDMAPFTEAQMQTALDALRGHAGRVVVVSSADVYRVFGALLGIEDSPLPSPPCDEDAPLRTVRHPYRHRPEEGPDWLRDYDKIPIEQLVLNDSQVRGTALRLGAVYGPGDNQHRMGDIVEAIDSGREVIEMQQAQAEARWPYVYVENAAAAIALAVTDERAAGRVYNVGPPRTPTNEEFTRGVIRALGWEGRIVVVPGETPRHQVDLPTQRIRDELGYTEPVSFDDSVRRAAEWERFSRPR
jgi:nucleoside-diphosphate-sugar epimerase